MKVIHIAERRHFKKGVDEVNEWERERYLIKHNMIVSILASMEIGEKQKIKRGKDLYNINMII